MKNFAFDATALVINLAAQDVNDVLATRFFPQGERDFSGSVPKLAGGISDLNYRLRLRQPSVSFKAGRLIALDLEVSQAVLQIGQVKKKILREIRCHDLTLIVSPDHPLALHVVFRMQSQDRRLKVSLKELAIKNQEFIQISGPGRCQGLGPLNLLMKPLVRHVVQVKVRGLEELVEKALGQKTEALVRKQGGTLEARFSLPKPWANRLSLRVFPSSVVTAPNRVRVVYGAELTSELASQGEDCRALADPVPTSNSFVSISKCWLQGALAELLSNPTQKPFRFDAQGKWVKKFLIPGLSAIIPGLAERADLERVGFLLSFLGSPQLAFEKTEKEDLALRFSSSGFRLRVLDLSTSEKTLADIFIRPHVQFLPVLTSTYELALVVSPSFEEIEVDGLLVDSDLVTALLEEVVIGGLSRRNLSPFSFLSLRLMPPTSPQPHGFRDSGGFLALDLAPFGLGVLAQR